MTNAAHDENGRTTIICASKDDATIIVPLKINPSNHGLKINDNSTGSDNGNNSGNALLDENSVPVWAALASDGSGRIIEIYADAATGSILINSN